MLEVFKYQLRPDNYIDIQLPEGAQILPVQTQGDMPCLWALVNPENRRIKKRFRLAGTGHPIKEDRSELFYHGTFQLHGGALIFHLFELSSPPKA